MKIDLTCPVELWQYAMPTEEAAECTFIMNNLSEKTVTSVQVTLSCYDKEDELLFRQTERVQGLKAGVREHFSMVILPTEWKGVEGVDLVIEKVWFDDASVWRKGNAPLAHYTSNAMTAGRALDELRFVAGKDAAGYPQQQDEVWLCVCGRANALDSQICCRCERRKEAVFASFTRENVGHLIAAHEKKLADTARKAREDNNILQENQEKQRSAKRRKHRQRMRMAAAMLIMAAAAVVVVMWGIPTLRYNTAEDLLAGGHYQEARAAFAELEDWKDSAVQVLECDYQAAQAKLRQGTEEALIKAEQAFLALGEYRDSASLALEAAYGLAELALEADDFETAAQRYEELDDYLDSAAMLTETHYRQADALLTAGKYATAREQFVKLVDYQESRSKADQCTYQIGLAHMENDEYERAVEELSALGDYEDAPAVVEEAYYQMAEEAFVQEEYEKAGDWYLLAGSYGNARARANDCIYQLAQEKRAAGEYEKARELFLRIPDYLDSEGQAVVCIYLQADEQMNAGEFETAAALFEQAVSYDDAQEKLDECRYQLALAALEDGNAVEAEALLADIQNHKKAETKLRTVRYELALADQKAGMYAQAAERFEALDSYKNSKNFARQCRYALAAEALSAGRYDEAIEAFRAMGSYQDSEKQLEQAQYQRAMSMKENGDLTGAEIALRQMEDSTLAREALFEMSMAEGAALENEGKYEEAIRLYEETPDRPEAQARILACRYALAVKLRDAGDWTNAGDAFHALGDYEDAREQSEECYTQAFGPVAQEARDAMANEDYLGVISLLRNADFSETSKAYGDLPDLFKEACYQQAEALYRGGKPYEAIPYYQHAQRNTEEKLGRRAYLILGDWVSNSGKEASFRMDGTCDLMGETLYFRVSNFSLYTGADQETMTITHKLSTIDGKGMSLRDIRSGQDVVYKFTRKGAFELPQMDLPGEDNHAN